MRDQYESMFGIGGTPDIWGLSVLGTSMRVYYGDEEADEVTPYLLPRPEPVYLLPPSFLAGKWDLDLLSQKGFEKMKEIVTDILSHTESV